MGRSYRGLGFVVLMLLVVAPLTLFAVLSLFEDDSADSIRLSLDGVHWEKGLHGALLASRESWEPGESRSAIVYLKNAGPDPVDADVAVLCRSTDEVVTDRYLTMTAQVDEASPEELPVYGEAHDVHVDGLGSEEVVPITLEVTLADTAPIGSRLDGRAVDVRLSVTGMRTEESGPPSLLDATGAQLWLAPILLVVGAGVALVGQAGRSPGPPGSRDTRS
ncbi:hypothetical protein [Nocardioides dilutus]